MTPRGTKPKKPRDCPLFPHSGGTWCATIGGKHKHFGPWHDLPMALRRHEAYMSAFRVGQEPRAVPDGSVPLRVLGNRYVTNQHNRAKVGEITLRSFRDIKK